VLEKDHKHEKSYRKPFSVHHAKANCRQFVGQEREATASTETITHPLDFDNFNLICCVLSLCSLDDDGNDSTLSFHYSTQVYQVSLR
jgi:hypothetical protein